MLRPRRGAILLLVLGVAALLLALIAWGSRWVAWSRGQTRAAWDLVVVEFAAAEVERAARGATMARLGATETVMWVTTNRLIGQIAIRGVAPLVWQVRWGVGGAGGLWREGGWLALESVTPGTAPGMVSLVPLPGLPPLR